MIVDLIHPKYQMVIKVPNSNTPEQTKDAIRNLIKYLEEILKD